jgi:DNA polymerase-3 subunit alpha
MFDLWGESVPVPVQSLELSGGDVPLKEKLAWEKELLGVYVSEHPFSAVAASAARDTNVFCGHINEELVGQSVTVAGMVSSVRPLLTKNGRQFISAALEDLEGSVELTVWPEVFERTRDLWADGELILVHGKVNDRRGVIQISCDGAQRYEVSNGDDASQPGDDRDPPDRGEPVAPLASVTVRQAQGERGGAPYTNGNGLTNSNGHINGNGHAKRRSLAIELRESSDPDRDLITFETLLDLLQRYQGPDEVRLTVLSGGNAVPLELPQLGIRMGPDLVEGIRALVGDSAVITEEA